jgi:hypothetical protein
MAQDRERSEKGGERKGGSGRGGGDRPAGRGHGRGDTRREVLAPFELEEKAEYFEIGNSGASFDFIKDLDDKLQNNWMHVLMCTILINSTGRSHTLDTIFDDIAKRGVDTTLITKEKLSTFLCSDYYYKHETFLDPKIETCRFSLNHQAARPSSFMHDVKAIPPFTLPDEKLKEDAVLFILSMARGIMSQTSAGNTTIGDVLFKDMQRLTREYLGIDVTQPGKAIKPINLRTRIITYEVDADMKTVEKKYEEGIAILKAEADKVVRYRFLPHVGTRW